MLKLLYYNGHTLPHFWPHGSGQDCQASSRNALTAADIWSFLQSQQKQPISCQHRDLNSNVVRSQADYEEEREKISVVLSVRARPPAKAIQIQNSKSCWAADQPPDCNFLFLFWLHQIACGITSQTRGWTQATTVKAPSPNHETTQGTPQTAASHGGA